VFSRTPDDLRLVLLVGGAGLIGVADDLLILLKRRALGLRARWKFVLLGVWAIAYLALLQSRNAPLGYQEQWFGTQVTPSAWLWCLLSMGAFVGAANALYLTDGLAGLATVAIIPPLFVIEHGT